MKKNTTFLTKLAIVAMAIGLFSPSVTIESEKTVDSLLSYVPNSVSVSLFKTAEARRGRGGGARRGGARRGGHRTTNRTRNRNSNRNVNRNRNVNKNVNVNINRNSSRHYHGGGHHHGHRHSGFYGGGGYYYGGAYHPVARFTFAMLTAAAIGTIISSSSMSSSCTTMNINGISYKNCDGTWFKPFYENGNLQYKAVPAP